MEGRDVLFLQEFKVLVVHVALVELLHSDFIELGILVREDVYL